MDDVKRIEWFNAIVGIVFLIAVFFIAIPEIKLYYEMHGWCMD